MCSTTILLILMVDKVKGADSFNTIRLIWIDDKAKGGRNLSNLRFLASLVEQK